MNFEAFRYRLEKAPDATTVWLFRELLTEAGATARRSQPRPPDHGRLSYTRFHTTLTDAIPARLGRFESVML